MLPCNTFFPVTRELRVILDTQVVACEVKRWSRVGVSQAKTSTCSCLFTARVENEPQEIPCYIELKNCEINSRDTPAMYDARFSVAVLYRRSILPFFPDSR